MRMIFAAERAALHATLAVVAESVASMIQSLPDPTVKAPGSDWTVGEHAAHTYQAQQCFASIVGGAVWDFPGNEPSLAGFTERNGVVLAKNLRMETTRLLEALDRNQGRDRFHGWFGLMSMQEWASYAICHLHMHGVPFADHLGLPHGVRTEHVALALPFLRVAVPIVGAGKRGPPGRLEFDLKGIPPFAFAFSEDAVLVEVSPAGPADCCIHSEPVPFLLQVLGLRPANEAFDTGEMTISGANPELALTYRGRVPNG